MQTPLVSIIIPTYNRAHLIGETLESVLAQTYINWECIVVDDGSTDTTESLLKDYCQRDSRFQYQHRPTDRTKGANACRNYGFELSKGEYVNWFDDDDLMLPKKLVIQLEGLHNSSYDYTICQTMMFDVKRNKEIGFRAPKLSSDNIFEDYIFGNIFWLTGAPLWKRSFLDQYRLLFDETLQQAQDYDFHMRVLNISENYLSIEEVYVLFKYHSSNMSNSIANSSDKIISNLKVKINIINNFKIKFQNENVIEFYKALFELYKMHTRNNQLNYSKILLKCLMTNMDVLSYNWVKEKYLKSRLKLGYLSYLFFSKGYRILKFNI